MYLYFGLKKRGRWLGLVVVGLMVFIIAVAISNGVFAFIGGAPRQTTSSDVDLQKGLVGWWKMDGNAKDSTPNGNNGVSTASVTTDRKGRANSAYSFTGTQYITLGHPSALNFTGDFSFSYWIKFNNLTSQVVWYPLSKGNYNSSGWSSGVLGGAAGICSNLVGSIYYSAGNNLPYGCSSTQLTSGTWNHVATTVSGTTIKNYLNGQLVGSGTATTTFNAATDLNIGRRSDAAWYLNGSMDDVRIWNRTLSTNEVTTLQKSYDESPKLASGEKSLLGWWKFDGNTKDSTPNAFNGTLAGSPLPTLTTDRKGVTSSAYSISGSGGYVSIPDSPSLNMTSRVFTVTSWMKSSTPPSGYSGYITKFDSSGPFIGSGWDIGIQNGSLRTAVRGTTSNIDTGLVSGPSLFDNVWHHIAVAVTASSIKTYIDGSLVATTNGTWGSAAATTTTPVFIGYRTNSTSLFSGSIDDVHIYNRELDSTEIATQAKAYNAQVSVGNLQKGLIGYWPMNGTAKDATPYANNGTIGGATLIADRKGRQVSSYDFNGSSGYIDAPVKTQSFSKLSISTWIKWGVSNVAGQPVIVQYSGSDHFWFRVNNSSAGKYCFYLGFTSSPGYHCSNTSATRGVWQLVTITYDSTASTASLYIDGVLDKTATTTGNMSFAGVMTFGSYSVHDLFYQGGLDDIRLYNRTLSAAEVAQLYKEYR